MPSSSGSAGLCLQLHWHAFLIWNIVLELQLGDSVVARAAGLMLFGLPQGKLSSVSQSWYAWRA